MLRDKMQGISIRRIHLLMALLLLVISVLVNYRLKAPLARSFSTTLAVE